MVENGIALYILSSLHLQYSICVVVFVIVSLEDEAPARTTGRAGCRRVERNGLM